ncbi:MAG TPA: hypothetical protein DEF51_05735 [Myxococcales bacterium]|nr:hypothetical protein [Myxococcales bacterium]
MGRTPEASRASASRSFVRSSSSMSCVNMVRSVSSRRMTARTSLFGRSSRNVSTEVRSSGRGNFARAVRSSSG